MIAPKHQRPSGASSGGRGFSLDLVSRYRAPIYGICILWVVFFHGYAIDGVDYSFGNESLAWFASLMGRGNVGVDVFLFLSGISLYFSWSRNPDLRDYFTKRLVRLAVPLLVIDGLYWFVRCVVWGQLGGVSGFIRRIAMVSLWTDGTGSTWYVELQLVLYVAYPFVHEFLFRDGSAPRTALRAAALMAATYLVLLAFWDDAPALFNQVEIALTRIPVFLLGCAMGRAVYRGMRLPAWCGALPFVGVAAFFGVLGFVGLSKPWVRFFYLVGGVSFAYAFALLFAGFSALAARFGLRRGSLAVRGLSCVGGASLELYLSHIMVNQVYGFTPLYVAGSLGRYCVVAAISLVASLVASRFIVKPVSKRLLAAAKKIP